MTDMTALTPGLRMDDDLDIDRAGYANDDRDGRDNNEGESLGFIKFAYKLIENDPRVQALRDEPELTSEQHADLRMTAMEIERDIQYAQDDFKRLNPDATEAQVEEYIAAVFERDIVTLDRIQKEVQRKHQEKEGAEASDKRKSVLLNTTDTAQNGGAVENRFTGQNTINGIRRILFGNG